MKYYFFKEIVKAEVTLEYGFYAEDDEAAIKELNKRSKEGDYAREFVDKIIEHGPKWLYNYEKGQWEII